MLDPLVLDFCKSDVADIGGLERSEFICAEEGRFEMRAYPGPDSANNIGTVHGGFLLALADMAGTGEWQEGQRFSSGVSSDDVQSWVNGLGL